ncbi:MAG: ABC transporter substrate-binding protein, partial [Bacillota bacterium]
EPVIEGAYQITFPIIKALPEDLILKKLIFKILPQYKLNQPLSPQSEIARKPVGTGYYKFERREPTLLELKRSDSNVGSTKIDRIKVYIMPDYGTQKESLINKDVDLLIEVPPTEIKYLEASGFDICPYNSYEFSFIAINFNNKLLQLKNVRQALTIGYNRRNVLEKVYQRQGEVISGPFPRGSAYFLEEIKPFEYNPKSAKKLLSEAGFTKTNSEGFLVNTNGDELKFTLSVPKNRKWDDYQSKAVKQFVTDMKEIGVKIIIGDMEFENYLENIKYKHDYDLAYGTLVFDDVGNVYPLFHSSNSKPGQENFITYNNPEVDQLLKQQNESMDESQKINLGRRLHKLLKEECPYVFLWSLENNAVVNPRIRNVHYKMTPFTFFGHINEWYIKE